jgi:WS/DGAT/MGAT family acyltransferase
MAAVDVAWLHMEQPTNLMMVSALLSFERSLSLERLREVVLHRLLRHRRFTERVVPSGSLLRGPRWMIDPGFDLDSHLCSTALPPPGDEEILRDLVSRLMSTPLDRSRPLWQIHLIENYRGGSAILVRIHHCIADGIALMRVLLSITDEHEDPELLGEHDQQSASLLNAVGKTIRHQLDLLVHPHRLLELAQHGVRGSTAAASLLLRARDPKTVLRGPLGARKRAAWSESIDLDQVKWVGRTTGCTVNDVLLAALAGALRRYLEFRDDRTAGLDLRAAVPVNLRADGETTRLGNRFGLVFAPLPIGLEDPLDRLFLIRHRMNILKESPEAAVVLGLLATAGHTSAAVQRRLVELVAGKASLVVTNVPGPGEQLHVGGVPLRSMMFWVPMSGRVGLGISILSYAGKVRLGISSDASLIPEPDRIARYFHKELEQLVDISRLPIEPSQAPSMLHVPVS